MSELNLLKKRKKGVLRIVFSRTGIILLLFLLAVALFAVNEIFLAGLIYKILGGVGVFNVIVIIALLNSDMDSSAKLTWILVVSVTSVFGALFYLYTKINFGGRKAAQRCSTLNEEHRNEITSEKDTLEKLKKESPQTAALVKYLNNSGTFPVSDSNRVTYYPLGEYKFAAMIEELKKAEKFIFLEYFIIDEGKCGGAYFLYLQKKLRRE